MIRYIKFIGDFKILIPMGFKFGKYFARNHKGYSKPQKDTICLTDMHIWVKGRDITIGDMNQVQSFYIGKSIIEETYPVYEQKDLDEFKHIPLFDVGDSKDNMINRNTGEIMDHFDLLKKYGIFDLIKNGEKRSEKHNYNKDGWNEIHISKEAIKLVKEFNEKGLLEFVE